MKYAHWMIQDYSGITVNAVLMEDNSALTQGYSGKMEDDSRIVLCQVCWERFEGMWD